MKLNLNFKLKTIKGDDVVDVINFDANNKPITAPAFAYSTVADILAKKTKYFKPAKAYSMAMTLQNNKELEIDSPDSNDLIKELEENDTLHNFVKAQIILEIEEAKKKSEAEKDREKTKNKK